MVEAPPAEQPAAAAEPAAEAPELPKLPPGQRIKKPVRGPYWACTFARPAAATVQCMVAIGSPRTISPAPSNTPCRRTLPPHASATILLLPHAGPVLQVRPDDTETKAAIDVLQGSSECQLHTGSMLRLWRKCALARWVLAQLVAGRVTAGSSPVRTGLGAMCSRGMC